MKQIIMIVGGIILGIFLYQALLVGDGSMKSETSNILEKRIEHLQIRDR